MQLETSERALSRPSGSYLPGLVLMGRRHHREKLYWVGTPEGGHWGQNCRRVVPHSLGTPEDEHWGHIDHRVGYLPSANELEFVVTWTLILTMVLDSVRDVLVEKVENELRTK